MKITIYQNREVYKEESKIGNDSENKVETLEFEFPEEYRDFTKYIEFQIKGEKYVDLIEDNKYVITREVAKYGKIKTQVVLKKNTENDVLIFKSNVFELNVSKSINASENLVNTVGVDLIEKIVTKNNEQDTRLNNLELDNTTNKENISNLQNDNTTNKTNIKSLQDDNEVNKTDISNIKQEQTTQNTNISNLQTDNTSNKAKILDLEAKNTEQDTSIQTNTESIEQIKSKDTTQDKLIKQLQTKVVNLEAENTSLKNQIPSGEATGNPIHLTDSSNLPCEIAVVGNSEQETREGYNLLDIATLNIVEQVDVSSYKKEKTGYEIITIEKEDTSNYSRILVDTSAICDSTKNYILSCDVVCNKSGKMLLGWYGINLLELDTLEANVKKHIKLSILKQSPTFLSIGCFISNATIKFENLMIYEGTEDKDYEQYGAMPSPDYPSEIVTVGQNGSAEIKVDNGLETTDTNYQSYTKVLPIQEEMLDEDYISDKEYHNWEKIDSYNGEEITTEFKSTTGELSTGATVYYKLSTPKALELTEEQKSVLNSFYTYKGITNISVDGIGTLKVNYKKDLETIINNISATSVAE